jgi:hypothetical protein
MIFKKLQEDFYMSITRLFCGLSLGLAALVSAGFAESVAKISIVEGEASVLRAGAEEWRPARPNMPISLGDQLYTRKESFMEIQYSMGTVLRMNENTKIIMQMATSDSARTQNVLGNVWVNMKKLTKQGKTFDVSSPTAVASVRGTIFQMDALPDSATYVSVFDGKVAVGPSDSLKKKIEATKPAKQSGDITEVPGPEEVPGPYEVSLDAWKTIIAGQRISVRNDGKFSQEKFDMKKAGSTDAFVKKNQELDKKLMKE